MKNDMPDAANACVTSAATNQKAIFIVGPDGQAGGGMGRVKDYILAAGHDRGGRYVLVPLITRDGGGAIISIWLVARAVLVIWTAVLRGRAALVHVNFGDKGSFLRKGVATVLARTAGVPVVLHLHAVLLEAHYAQGGPVPRWLIRQPFRAATTVVVLGERWRRWLTDELDVQSEKIEILYNGVPVPIGAPRVFPVSDRAELLFLGNLLERKGVPDLLASLTKLSGKGWHATIAGGGDIDHYREIARTSGLSDRVTFTGWVDQTEARALVAASDTLVLPSYEEGLPLVILEALGAGTPVVCTPVGSIPEVLTDGETALFCTPGDRSALTACIARLLSDPNLRQELSRNGLALFARKFSLRAFHKSLFDIYRRRCGIDFVLNETTASGEHEAA